MVGVPKQEKERELARKRLADAHLRLLKSNDFQLHLEWLSEQREAFRNLSEAADGPDMYRAQGRSLDIGDIFDKIDSSGAAKARFVAKTSRKARGQTNRGAY